jgi:acyl-CoA reductase-like NAD-dependent aldehyde dehydrogenase
MKSEQTDVKESGLMLAEVAEEAGFPVGVINAVTHAPGAAGAIRTSSSNVPKFESSI